MPARSLVTISLILFLTAASSAPVQYPETKKEPVQSRKHGISISDSYTWMENEHSPDLQIWIEQQNRFTDQYLRTNLRTDLEREFHKIVKKREAKSLDVPKHKFVRQKMWQERVSPQEHQRRILSKSERYEIELTSDSGSDLQDLRIIDNDSGKHLKDLLKVKFTDDVQWLEDESAFIYTSDLDGRLGGTHPVIRLHKLGTKQNLDKVIFRSPEPDAWINLEEHDGKWYCTLDQRYYVNTGLLDVDSGEFRLLWSEEPGLSYPFTFEGNYRYQISYKNADLGEVTRRNLTNGTEELVVKASKLPIYRAALLGDSLFTTYHDDTSTRLFENNLKTKTRREIRLPGPGSLEIGVVEGALFAAYSEYTTPLSTWKFNSDTGALDLLDAAADTPIKLEAKKSFYTTHNGKKATIWLVHKEGLTLDKNTPVYLYGYGGFGVNILPRYRDQYLPLYKRGGVFAVVTLPGGLEYGRRWQLAGQLHNKRNVFDDFAAAAQHLYDNGISSPEHLAIGGGSNGGLLVGATMNLYPRRFKAAIPEVGVMDLINFQRFTGGKWWMTDYGNRDNAHEFHNQLALSPFHNLKRRRYPATLVIAADFDDRVVPSHSYRYAAKLQNFQRGHNPVLLHTRVGSSHGVTGTEAEEVRYLANKWGFILEQIAQ